MFVIWLHILVVSLSFFYIGTYFSVLAQGIYIVPVRPDSPELLVHDKSIEKAI